MELDELKDSWQRLDRRVQELTLINRRLVIDNSVRKARWRLAPLVLGASAGAFVGAYFAVLSAVFIGDHLDSPAARIAGVALLVMSLVFFAIHSTRLFLAHRIDFTRPVLEIQRSLATLQRWEAWSFHAVWVACCLLPLGFLNGAAIALKGAKLWEDAPVYLLVNLLVWLVAGVGPLLVYLWSRRRNGRIAARMDTFLSSHSISSAKAAIEEIDEFARP
jgi:cytochrome c biogenesis protein CcdA